jgi:hypothetical protein
MPLVGSVVPFDMTKYAGSECRTAIRDMMAPECVAGGRDAGYFGLVTSRRAGVAPGGNRLILTYQLVLKGEYLRLFGLSAAGQTVRKPSPLKPEGFSPILLAIISGSAGYACMALRTLIY